MKISSWKIIISVIMLLLFSVACSESSNNAKTVKPDSGSMRKSDEPVRVSDNSISDPELESKENRFLNSFYFISAACANYQTAYGSLPLKLEDLIDGFMLVWPRNIYSDGPIKTLNQMPDPGNPDHIGKVYYERIDDLHGFIHFLSMDIESFRNGRPSWILNKYEIDLPVKEFVQPDDSLIDSSILSAMLIEDRVWFGYRCFLYQSLHSVIGRALSRDGNLNKPFPEVIRESDFYLVDSGIAKLKDGIDKGKVSYDIGDIGDGLNYYYDVESLDLTQKIPRHFQRCLKPDLRDEISNYDKYTIRNIECPPAESTTQSIFKSADFSTYDFKDDLTITKADLV
jgi:hypothetical protein